MLLLCGMTVDAVGRIYPLRIILTGLACTLAAMLIALIMGAFSFTAVGICTCAAGATCFIALVSSEIVIVR